MTATGWHKGRGPRKTVHVDAVSIESFGSGDFGGVRVEFSASDGRRLAFSLRTAAAIAFGIRLKSVACSPAGRREEVAAP